MSLGTRLLAALFALLIIYVSLVKVLHTHSIEYGEATHTALTSTNGGTFLTPEGHVPSCFICDFTFAPAEESTYFHLTILTGEGKVLATPAVPLQVSSYSSKPSSRAPPFIV